ncbi:MAG: Protein gp37 [Actinomycetota bacterium]|nr:Protein gp37 [Actinomycetota bacterium]
MGSRTSIEWTDTTWNPVTGCDRVSPGCEHCYAATMARRLRAMGHPRYQRDGNPVTSGPGFGVSVHPEALSLPYSWRAGRRVFVNSMSDLFHAQVPVEVIRQVLAVAADTPQHTYQVLTKRSRRLRRLAEVLDWPVNVWVGVSVEDAGHLYRVEDLTAVPASVRFLSAEPLLGPLVAAVGPCLDVSGLKWVITGGESGPGARSCQPSWVRAIRDVCEMGSVAFFHKQWGGARPRVAGRLLDGRTYDEFPPVPAASETVSPQGDYST